MVDFATLKLVGDTSGLKPVAPALDAVVAKAGQADAAVKKLGAATTAMGAGARKAAADTKAVSTALDSIEADARSAAVALEQTEAALNKVGMQSQIAGGAVGNLGAQVFDIGMMMQAGQNPFVLMVQQGSQVAQVLGPMGAAGAVAALKATFVSLLNPINLAVFAIIGGTAALVQWATSAGDATAETDALTAALERQKAVQEALTGETERLRLERQMLFSGAEFTEEQEQINEINRLTAERVVLEERLNQLVTTGGRAAGFAAEAAAKRDVLQAELDANQARLDALNKQRDLKASAEEFKATIDVALSVQQAIASTDISGPWQRVLGSIQAAIGKAREYAAVSQMQAIGGGRGAGPGGPLVGSADLAALQAGGGTIRNMPVPGVGGGGGGGGGGSRSAAVTEAQKEADAIQKVVDKLRSEIEAVGATTEARRLQQELQRAGVTIYSTEGQQIAALVEELTALEAKQKLVSETMRGIESAAEGFFVGVLSGAKDLKSAIGDLLGELGKLFLNQAFKMLWSGGGGMGGGIGGFFAGLFDAGGRIQAGQLGLVGEKRPEFVDGKLVTRPTLIEGPANVTGGAATSRLLDRAAAPSMQVAMRRQSQFMQAPAPRVTVAPPQVVVLDDPRRIDAYMRSPAGERSASRQQRRLGNG